MTKTNPTASKEPRILKVFRNPYVGILGSIASIIGLILAVYFWHESRRYRELVYFVNPAKAVVIKSGQTSKLNYFYEGKEIKSDVTAIQIAIWNQGSESIKKENIVSNINISTTPSVHILEVITRKKSRDAINLVFDQSMAKNGTIPLTWNILENGDGILLQIIYAGDTNVIFSLEGLIEGQASIKEIKYSGSILSPAEQFSQQKKSVRWFIYIFLGLLFVYVILIFISKKKTEDKFEKMFYYIFIITFLGIIAILLYLFSIKVSEPPFGF